MSSKSISSLNRVPSVQTERKIQAGVQGKYKSVKALVPIHQATVFDHHTVYYTQSFNNVPAALFRNSGARYVTTLEKQAFSKIKSAVLKISISVATSSVQVIPTPYFFQSIQIRLQHGSGDVLTTLYDDTMMFSLMLAGEGKSRYLQKVCNLEDWYENSYQVIPTSGTAVFYLPLVGSVLDTLNIFWANSQGDLQLAFTPAATLNISGSGVCSCDALDIIIESEQLLPSDEKHHLAIHDNYISSSRYLDAIQVSFINEVLTAGSQTKLNLNSITGDVSFLMFMVRDTYGSNTSSANLDYLDLGKTSLIDILDSGNKSVFGSGQALTSDFVKNVITPRHIDCDMKGRSIYILPFCNDIKKAFMGVKDGFYPARGQNGIYR